MKNRMISLFLVFVMCIGFTACTGGNDSTPTPTASASTPAATPTPAGSAAPTATLEAPKEPVTLVIGTTQQPAAPSILSQSGMFGRINYNSVTYANFFFKDAEGNTQP